MLAELSISEMSQLATRDARHSDSSERRARDESAAPEAPQVAALECAWNKVGAAELQLANQNAVRLSKAAASRAKFAIRSYTIAVSWEPMSLSLSPHFLARSLARLHLPRSPRQHVRAEPTFQVECA